jgi:hypothetical protein
MRGILVVIVLIIVVFFAVPMVSEGTTNACQALEKRNVSATASSVAGSNTGVIHNVINSVGQAGATGDTATATASAQAPDTATPITCTYDYWKDLL